jgi:Uma2 family endonuclease
MAAKALMTVGQFAQMHMADTEDYELVAGELIPMSSGTFRHARIRDLIVRLIWSYFEGHPIGEVFGEVACRITDGTVRKPDVSIFLGERLKQIDLDQIPASFAPDIAVEVLSPPESAIDVRRKVRDYLRAGGSEVWLLDHANGEVLVHTGTGIRVLQGTDVLASPLLPGFSAAVAGLVVNV